MVSLRNVYFEMFLEVMSFSFRLPSSGSLASAMCLLIVSTSRTSLSRLVYIVLVNPSISACVIFDFDMISVWSSAIATLCGALSFTAFR